MMALEGVASDILDSLTIALKEKITEFIPNLLKDLTPEIVNLARSSIEDYIINNDLLQHSVRDSLISYEEEVSTFTKNFAPTMNEQLNLREDAYWKFTRCERLLGLYNECMNSEPAYVPRKFRKDKFHVMSKEELDIVNKMELKEMQLQCEILTCRREEFLKRCSDIDKVVEDIVKKSNMSEKATQNRIARWHFIVKEDVETIHKKWDTQINGMRSSFEKDKTFLLKHQEDRLKKNVPTKQRHESRKDSNTIPTFFGHKMTDERDSSGSSLRSLINPEDDRKWSTVVSSPPQKSVNSVQNSSSSTEKPQNERKDTPDRVNSERCASLIDSPHNSKEIKSSKNLNQHPSHEPPSPIQETPLVTSIITETQLFPSPIPETQLDPSQVPETQLVPSPITETQLVSILCQNPHTRNLRSSTSQKEH